MADKIQKIKLNKLNLGCGMNLKDDYINVDISDYCKPDVVWDLNNIPLPFDDEQFESVLAIDVMEHILYPNKLINDIWRCLKVGGRLEIRTSWYNFIQSPNSYRDPTHLHYFTDESFDYWIQGTALNVNYPQYAQGCNFKLLNKSLDGQEQIFTMQKIKGEK